MMSSLTIWTRGVITVSQMKIDLLAGLMRNQIFLITLQNFQVPDLYEASH